MPSWSSLTPLAVLAVALGGCDTDAAPAAQESTAAPVASAEAATGAVIDPSTAGMPMPELTLRDPDGATLATATLRGQPVLLNLWATWCAPCVKEMPLLDRLAADYAGRLKVVTVSQDLGDGDKVRAFFAERGLPHLTQWMDGDSALLAALEAQSLPVTVLYDAQGKEVWRVVGDLDWSAPEQRAAIDAVLGA